MEEHWWQRSEQERQNAGLHITPDQPRARSSINDNYCVNVLKAGLLARSQQTLKSFQLTEIPKVIRKTIDIETPQTQSVDFSVVNLAKDLHFWKTWEALNILKQGCILLFQTELDKVTNHHKLLCQSSQKPLSVGGITSASEQKCSRTCSKSKISRVFQLTFLGPKTKQLVETHTGPEQTKSFPQGRKIQNGDNGNHQDMGYLNSFKDAYFTYQFRNNPGNM